MKWVKQDQCSSKICQSDFAVKAVILVVLYHFSIAKYSANPISPLCIRSYEFEVVIHVIHHAYNLQSTIVFADPLYKLSDDSVVIFNFNLTRFDYFKTKHNHY